VRCFNHTMQLSVKALIKPFDMSTALTDGDAEEPPDADDTLDDTLSVDMGDADTDEDREGVSIDADSVSDNGQDEPDEEIDDDDSFDSLDPDARQGLLEGTAAVRTMLDKVHSYSLFHSLQRPLTSLSGSKTFICDRSLHNDQTPRMAQGLCCEWFTHSPHPSRCQDALEFGL
jgi:hypothetical protein